VVRHCEGRTVVLVCRGRDKAATMPCLRGCRRRCSIGKEEERWNGERVAMVLMEYKQLFGTGIREVQNLRVNTGRWMIG
jgi:hypothetical protein